MKQIKRLESNKTTIAVRKEIRDKLDNLKLVPGEHLDSVISRLIKEHEENKE